MRDFCYRCSAIATCLNDILIDTRCIKGLKKRVSPLRLFHLFEHFRNRATVYVCLNIISGLVTKELTELLTSPAIIAVLTRYA